ncbi:hypothetical protein ELQ35_13160 [Peribacillus cavernae]|uniref:Uncharacterized protein n=1 Tax=Peribacillus cavernae TaxID=1674310 RepID=A0A3S0VHP1_9BACI|nr:hypothetical protein [Peribacillus cavernae]MDQ0217716.1 hypothetical protein [Peribacillus cavernae]RUQ28182.1 hypothetical protein ELQ35_13160 [Peribacillus cavernae]
MREFFIFFSYFSFASLAFTCAVLTYQIFKHGIGKTGSADEDGTKKSEYNQNLEDREKSFL